MYAHKNLFYKDGRLVSPFTLLCQRHGFNPRGGGDLTLRVRWLRQNESLQSIQRIKQGSIVSIVGSIYMVTGIKGDDFQNHERGKGCSGLVDIKDVNVVKEELLKQIDWAFQDRRIKVNIQV